MTLKRTESADPYAPPPMYHDRSGRVVRIGLLVILLAAVGAGYLAWTANGPPQTALDRPAAQGQQLADSGYRALPEQNPQAQPAAPMSRAPVQAPERRSVASTHSAPAPALSSGATAPPATNAPQMPGSSPPTQG